MLSRNEGACYTSSEYLLCGIPVVSTEPSPNDTLGGRQAWYDDENHIYCRPDADAVRDAVEETAARKVDPHSIRANHINKMEEYRAVFRDEVFSPICDKIGFTIESDSRLREILWDTTANQWKLRMESCHTTLDMALDMLCDNGPIT